MHSVLDQKAREVVMLAFRSGRIEILIATDILSRGIDVDDIAMVVNYDVPHEAEDYVHRIGRTARAGAGGKAVTFVSEADQQRWASIERFLGCEVRRDEIPAELGEGPQYRGGSVERRGRNFHKSKPRHSSPTDKKDSKGKRHWHGKPRKKNKPDNSGAK